MIRQILASYDVRRRVGLTLGILMLFIIGTYIPLYGVDTSKIGQLTLDPAFETLNAFAGGALTRYSILALGLSPYITASILVQVLQQGLVSKLTEWREQGDVGRRKLKRVTFVLSYIIGYLQALGVVYGLYRLSRLDIITHDVWWVYGLMLVTLSTASLILALLGEVITRHGIGQGSSLIIATGILSDFPIRVFDYLKSVSFVTGFYVLLLLVAILSLCIFFDTRRVSYPTINSRVANTYDMQSELPLKLNLTGVVPTIFASALLNLPSLIIYNLNLNEEWTRSLSSIFSVNTFAGVGFYTLFVLVFTFVYAHIQTNTTQLAEGLSRQGLYIEGVAPGQPTAYFLSQQVNRLSLISVGFLCIIISVPLILGVVFDLPTSISLSGTSLLILTGVFLETYKHLRGRLFADQYQPIIQTVDLNLSNQRGVRAA